MKTKQTNKISEKNKLFSHTVFLKIFTVFLKMNAGFLISIILFLLFSPTDMIMKPCYWIPHFAWCLEDDAWVHSGKRKYSFLHPIENVMFSLFCRVNLRYYRSIQFSLNRPLKAATLWLFMERRTERRHCGVCACWWHSAFTAV